MTITRKDETISIICDTCGTTFRKTFPHDEFAVMQREIQQEGWKPRRKAGAWEHACSHCAQSQDGRLL
ncbi:hypothetical protein ACQ3G6_17380 [Allorhizobium undicola]|uniref:hypothetical protein n=1 Tax=Allorhizobium undicola TaxID=78527 RepID=UPI003D347395